ncbi:hypothetical protein ACHAXM_010041 [Skeletonema potamos]
MDNITACTSHGPVGATPAVQYSYFHDESATIKLYPAATSITPPWSVNSRVYLESSSTLKSTTPLAGVEHTHTPFSDNILKMLSRYPLRRLLIRVGDVASTSITDVDDISPAQLLREERARGPSGTSVLASFIKTEKRGQSSNSNDRQRQSKDEYTFLLRYLLDNNLFPPCGAPLDSIRVRKHGHSIIVHPPKNETGSSVGKKHNVVEVESFLAADAATFCNPGIHAFLLSKGTKAGEGGWGAAANNGACHPDENWGLFDSLFPSSSVALSDLLLRSSLDAAPSSLQSQKNKRHSVWIDLDVSDSCYDDLQLGSEEDECIIRVSRGASYHIGLPSPSLQNVDGNEQRHVLNLSLGDLILGNKRGEGSKAWYPCPLSDSSRVLLHMPAGFTSKITAGTGVINNDANGSIDGGEKFEFDAMKWKDGYYDLSASWAQIYQTEQGSEDGKSSSIFGISRTVQRPLGLSSIGTLVSVLRYDQIASQDHSYSVKIESLDVLPGALIKPKIHTLRMVLCKGGGAGKDRFIPPVNIKECSSYRYSSATCSEVMLSDLQNHNLLLNSDGSWLIKRTIMLNPDSSLWMMVDFDEAYIPFQKFPADANRGIDAFPSRATFTIEADAPITLSSSSLLLLPPVPDMSMPFNVISLSCTLWAFVLGSLLNILVRRATESVKSDFTGVREKRPIDKLKEKMKDKIGRLKRVLSGKTSSKRH